MFGTLLKSKSKKSSYGKMTQEIYEACLSHVRRPVFYTDYGVPDSFDGRYDLLLVHIFIVLHRMEEEKDYDEIAQSLFDTVFQNMDQTLREMGIGDMGIPKHMKRMMKAFNGRMHAYQMAIAPEKLQDKNIEGLQATTIEGALRRNLFGTLDDDECEKKYIDQMAGYMRINLEKTSPDDIVKIRNGSPEFVLNLEL